MELLGFEKSTIHPHELSGIIETQAIQDIIESGEHVIKYDKDEYASQMQIINGKPWFLYRLRDRRDDGVNWKPSPLVDWHYNLDSDEFSYGSAVEESTYFLDPRYPLEDFYDQETSSFIKNPFEHLPYENPTEENLSNWFNNWQKVISNSNAPFPGYYSARNIPGTYRHVHTKTVPLLRDKGYKYLTAIPSWFHVAKMYEHMGFSYVNRQDQERMEQLAMKLPYGNAKERTEASWIVMLQFWAKLAQEVGYPLEHANGFVLRDNNNEILQFPLNPDHNLWMAKKI